MTSKDRLEARRSIHLTLPEFVARALEHRLAETNSIDLPGRDVELNDIVEWYLVGAITLQDVATLEQQSPGFARAVSRWLSSAEFEF